MKRESATTVGLVGLLTVIGATACRGCPSEPSQNTNVSAASHDAGSARADTDGDVGRVDSTDAPAPSAQAPSSADEGGRAPESDDADADVDAGSKCAKEQEELEALEQAGEWNKLESALKQSDCPTDETRRVLLDARVSLRAGEYSSVEGYIDNLRCADGDRICLARLYYTRGLLGEAVHGTRDTKRGFAWAHHYDPTFSPAERKLGRAPKCMVTTIYGRDFQSHTRRAASVQALFAKMEPTLVKLDGDAAPGDLWSNVAVDTRTVPGAIEFIDMNAILSTERRRSRWLVAKNGQEYVGMFAVETDPTRSCGDRFFAPPKQASVSSEVMRDSVQIAHDVLRTAKGTPPISICYHGPEEVRHVMYHTGKQLGLVVDVGVPSGKGEEPLVTATNEEVTVKGVGCDLHIPWSSDADGGTDASSR